MPHRRIAPHVSLLAFLIAILAVLASLTGGDAQVSNEPSASQPVVWDRYEFTTPEGDSIGLMRTQIAAGFSGATFTHDGSYLMLVEEGPICLTVEWLQPGSSIELKPATTPQEPAPPCSNAMICESSSCTIETEETAIVLNTGDSINVPGGSAVSIDNLNQDQPATLLIADNFDAEQPSVDGGNATPATGGCRGGCWGW